MSEGPPRCRASRTQAPERRSIAMANNEANPCFPYQHLAVLGMEKLKKYVPPEGQMSEGPYRDPPPCDHGIRFDKDHAAGLGAQTVRLLYSRLWPVPARLRVRRHLLRVDGALHDGRLVKDDLVKDDLVKDDLVKDDPLQSLLSGDLRTISDACNLASNHVNVLGPTFSSYVALGRRADDELDRREIKHR